MKVLFFTDEQALVNDIYFCLTVRYPDTLIATTNSETELFDLVTNEQYDLIFIDSSIHDVNIIDIIRQIRKHTHAMIIVLSQGESDLDRANGLESGADEYLSKPISPIEVLARCTATLRRIKGIDRPLDFSIELKGLTFNLVSKEVYYLGRRVNLTPIEYSLLSELAKNSGHTVAIKDLLTNVWGSEYSDADYLVKTVIYRLRLKLSRYGLNSRIIVNHKGMGYRLSQEV